MTDQSTEQVIPTVKIYICNQCSLKGARTLHFTPDEDCPVCGCHERYQYPYYTDDDYRFTGLTPKNHPDAIEAYSQVVSRGIRKAIKDMPIEAMKVGFEQFLAQIVISAMDNPGKGEEYIKLFDYMFTKLSDYHGATDIVQDKPSEPPKDQPLTEENIY